LNTEEFILETEYIQLNQLLKLLNWCESGGMANQVITEGYVLVNNNIATEKRKKIRKGDIVEFNGQRIEIR
jgi:ribosome-associated protein